MIEATDDDTMYGKGAIDKNIAAMPHPKTQAFALEEIQRIAADKRGNILLKDHCAWLELKLACILEMAKRGATCRAQMPE